MLVEDNHAAPLGVLFTGFMDKQNPSYKAKWGKRFLVLTYESFYWFKRKENYELFGEERGCIALKDMKTVRALHDAKHTFEIEDRSKNKRYFRPVNEGDDEHRDEQTEEGITAIRSAMNSFAPDPAPIPVLIPIPTCQPWLLLFLF